MLEYLENLQPLYQRNLSLVILTDKCLAAMNAAVIGSSSSKALLCLWHVIKAVLKSCRPFLYQRMAKHRTRQKK